MFFDPISSWLVALIADGIVISGEKSRGKQSQAQYDQKCINQENTFLNADIRKVKEQYGLTLAEMAYDQIKLHINITQNSYPFRCGRGQIIIDLDNQEYIIAVLEACANRYSRFKYPEAQQKAEWYKNAAVEARQRKELFAKQLEEARIQEEARQEKEQTMSNIYLILGLIIFFVFVIYFFIMC